MIRSSGYLTASGLRMPPASAMETVSGPTRPINIVRIIRIFENTFKEGVIPVDSPTVPKADTTSYRISARTSVPPVIDSMALITTVSTSTRPSARKTMACARRTSDRLSRRLWIL